MSIFLSVERRYESVCGLQRLYYFTCADFQKRRFKSVLEKTSFLVKFPHTAYDLFSEIKPKTKALHITQRLFMLPHVRQTETIRYKKSFLK